VARIHLAVRAALIAPEKPTDSSMWQTVWKHCFLAAMKC